MREWFESTIGDPVMEVLTQVLVWLHDLVEPAVGAHAWGWAIVLLTLIVRVALLPLAIKQTRSMRAMQKLQPQMKELQKKYKVDRSLLKKDPEQYKAKKQKLNEEMMALYQREGANPAASCLPLLAQAPIFIALFWTLRTSDELIGAPFYFVTRNVSAEGLTGAVSESGWPGWLLIAVMASTMFLAQKQMMARNPMAGEGPMAQQQKIMLYAMPGILAVVSFQFPLGILLYWVTTNFWQVAQQAIILREVKHEFEEGRHGGGGQLSRSATSGGDGSDNGDGGAPTGGSKGAKGRAGAPARSGKSAGSGKSAQGGKAAQEGKSARSGKKPRSKKPRGDESGGDGGPAPTASPGPRGGGKASGDGNGARSGASRGRRDHIPRRSGG